ncbi:MAG: hypothetical protein PHX64_05495 [Candidatus Omnitrophica bacterium]|nr:hypothetical protein [Candidatus Omnitrophota bacterium]
MRRELVIFAVILAVVLALWLFGRSLVADIAGGQIKSAFPGCDVSIDGIEVRSADLIAITGIDVKKGDALRYRIKQVEIRFSPLSLFTKIIPEVTVKGGSLEFNSPGKKLRDIIEYPALKPGKAFVVRSLIITGMAVELNTADWKLSLLASGNMKAGKTVVYDAKIEAGGIDLALLPKGLNAEGRVEMKGIMSGAIALRGEQKDITDIKGDFSTAAPGGSLVITDKEILKRLADNTKQPLSLIEDSFGNYDFTKGTLGVSRNKDSILLHVILEGAKGKRDVTVALHGF